MTNTRNGHRQRQMKREHRARCRAVNAPCVHCGQPIDYDAPPQSRNAFESDHRLPVKLRPDLAYALSNLQPSHASCNRSRGAAAPMDAPGQWVRADW